MELTAQLKDATEAAQQVVPLADAVTNLLQTPVGLIAAVLFFLWLLVNKDFSHLFDLFERKEKKRSEQLDQYVSKPELADPDSVRVLSDLRDAHYFKIATGIYAEKKLRKALITLHNRASHHISWQQIRRAFQYIEISGDEALVIRQFTLFELIGYGYNQLVGYTCLLFAAGLFGLFLIANPKTLSSFAWCVGGGLSSILFAMFVLSQNWPIHAAKKIRKELQEPATNMQTSQAEDPHTATADEDHH